jgi:myosin-5
VDDAMEFRTTQQALSTVGISVEKQWAVFKLLAALLHLGNVKIAGVRSDSNIDDTDAALQLSTRFLGVPLADFKKWTIKKQITTRSEKITTSLSAAQASVVRDSVSKFIYACLFEWLVDIVNESLAGEGGEAASRAETFIGILDIYGFEHFKKVSVPDCAQKSCWSDTRHTPSEFIRAVQHQLRQRKVATRVLCSCVQAGTGGIRSREDQLDIH